MPPGVVEARAGTAPVSTDMGTSPYSTTLDDNSPLISYSDFPATTVSCIDPQNCPYGSTLHQTATPGASATFSFTGTGLCIYGTRGPQYGVFNISIDHATQQGSAQAATAQYSQALWCQVGLMQGSHQVVLTNGDRELAFDYALAAQNGEWPESAAEGAASGTNGGAIAAGVILGIIFILGLIFWYRLSRYRMQGGKGNLWEAMFGKSKEKAKAEAEAEQADTWKNWPMLRYLPTYSHKSEENVMKDDRKEKEKRSASRRA